MKKINDKINEELRISKSFILNMQEIDYDKLIKFLQDMKEKDEKLIQIAVYSSPREWCGYSKNGESNAKLYNKTILSK